MAVDEGISDRSDKIAQKVLQIQQRLETAMASENVQEWKRKSAGHRRTGSDYATDERADESSDAALPVRPRHHPRGTKLVNNPPIKARRRERSDTGSTNRTGTGTITRRSLDTAASETPRYSSTPKYGSEREDKIPGQLDSEAECTDLPTPTTVTSVTLVRPSLRKVASGASLTALSPDAPTTAPTTPALTPAITTTTDESDTEFQSAYSASPRDSYGSFESKKASHLDSDDSGTSTDVEKIHVTEFTDLPVRTRLSSVATAVQHTTPTPSDVSAASNGRLAVRSR